MQTVKLSIDIPLLLSNCTILAIGIAQSFLTRFMYIVMTIWVSGCIMSPECMF